MRILRREADRIARYEKLGLNSRQAIDVMTHPALADDNADESVKDIYDVRSELVEWWNDLEKDKRYKGWSSNIFEVSFANPLFSCGSRATSDLEAGIPRPVASNSSQYLLPGDGRRFDILKKLGACRHANSGHD